MFTQNKAKLFKKLIITLVFEKNANFFAENYQKSQKIVIITSMGGLFLAAFCLGIFTEPSSAAQEIKNRVARFF
jgi:hypothetical protein